MRLKAVTSILLIFILACGAPGMAFAYNPLSGAVAITSQGTIPFTPGPLLDGFDGVVGVNAWGDLTGTFSSDNPPTPTARCDASYESSTGIVFGGTGHSLKLDYNVTKSESYVGYSSKLGGEGLSSYNHLSFWVKGANAINGEYFKIELKNNFSDDNSNHAAVYVTDYLDGGVTTDWQKVVIPLDAFANINDWTSMREFVIVFENSQSTTNGSPTSGIVYIDNINFGYQFLGFVRIDHFGDKVSIGALGGNCNHTSGSGAVYGSYEYTDVATNCRDYANGLGFHFENVYDPRYYAYYSVVGGGDTGSLQQPRDFSAYDKLAFWAKSSSNNVNSLKLELHCPTSQDNYFHYFQNTFTTSWQYISLPLTEFTTTGWPGQGTSIISSGKINSLGEIVFTRDGWFSKYGDWDYLEFSGSFYIDKVQLEENGYAPDITLPGVPSAPGVVGNNVLTLTTTASSRSTDSTMENIRFEYNDGGWKAIGYDYDTTDAAYSVVWDVRHLTPGTYNVRVVAMDASGNVMASNSTPYTRPN